MGMFITDWGTKKSELLSDGNVWLDTFHLPLPQSHQTTKLVFGLTKATFQSLKFQVCQQAKKKKKKLWDEELKSCLSVCSYGSSVTVAAIVRKNNFLRNGKKLITIFGEFLLKTSWYKEMFAVIGIDEGHEVIPVSEWKGIKMKNVRRILIALLKVICKV